MSFNQFHRVLVSCMCLATHGLFGIAALSASCAPAPAPASTQPSPSYTWDLSTDRKVNRFPIVWKNGEESKNIYGPGKVSIILPDGISSTFDFWLAEVRRDLKNPQYVTALVVYANPGTATNVAFDAFKLAKDFRIEKIDQIQRFSELNGNITNPEVGNFADDPSQPRSVVIRRSLAGPGKEWVALVGLGFPDR